jgi:SAM-dependent methyltransferase
MSLPDWLPPRVDGPLARNGYALVTDLESPAYAKIMRALEGYQAAFLGRTREQWGDHFPIPGAALAHFGRQWEFPYAWANLAPVRGRLLDAGSGITFFPFLLATAGFEVHCCDEDSSLGLAARYHRAAALTGCRVTFTEASLTDLPYPAGSFDAVACISVLEHVGAARLEIITALVEMLRPGGRLVLTCDVDLRREGGLTVEDVGALLAHLDESCDLLFPLDLRRPGQLLTSETVLASAPWRLPWPWRPPVGPATAPAVGGWRDEFRSIALLGVTAEKRHPH